MKEKLAKDLEVVSDKKLTAITDFVKTILLLLSTVLAVLISLYNISSPSCIEIVCFIITIVLFALNILFGSLLLYGGIYSLIEEEKLRYKRLEDLLRGIESTKVGEFTPSKNIYDKYWWCFKKNSVASLVMVVVYSIVKVVGV